jgi:hypothetical protein
MIDVISTNALRGHLLKTGATWRRDGSLIMDFSQECFYLATLEDASWLKETIMTRAKLREAGEKEEGREPGAMLVEPSVVTVPSRAASASGTHAGISRGSCREPASRQPRVTPES